MARFPYHVDDTFSFIFLIIIICSTNPNWVVLGVDELSITDSDFLTFHGDYSPPAPPPPSMPPHSPSLSCETDLYGIGSLETTCSLNSSLNFTDTVYIEGSGSLYILPDVVLSCPIKGCSILVNISGDFVLNENAMLVAGTVYVNASNSWFLDGSLVNVTGLAGPAPDQTSGTPAGVQGGGGGHGGRGASCLIDDSKLPDDVWGGDTYSWSTLSEPWSYGSQGGTTSREEVYGGAGGGRIRFEMKSAIDVAGSFLSDGGDGGVKGGGGSGGSIFIKAQRM